MRDAVHRHIEGFTREAAPATLSAGQGYLSSQVGEFDLELAWYREDDFHWTLSLAVDSPTRRIETPAGTSFQCHPGFDAADVHGELAGVLQGHYVAMLAVLSEQA